MFLILVPAGLDFFRELHYNNPDLGYVNTCAKSLNTCFLKTVKLSLLFLLPFWRGRLLAVL